MLKIQVVVGKNMFVNTNYSNQINIKKQNFRQNAPVTLPSQKSPTLPPSKEINLNNTPSVQNQAIIQPKQPDYKVLQTFSIPNIGEGKVYELKNGHKVIILPKSGPTAIYTHIKTGGINDPKDKDGLSHFVEHMVATPDKYAENSIEYNATTDSTTTVYFAKYPVTKTQELDKLIIMQANTLQNPDFSQEKVDKEKAIILQEFSRKKNKNTGEAQNILFNNLFNHSYENSSVVGTEKTVSSFTQKDIIDHYNNFYRPDNMVTTIVGDIAPEDTIKIASKYFNKETNQTPLQIGNNYPDFSNPIQKTKRVDFKSDKITDDSVTMAFVGPYEQTPKNQVLGEITSNILKNSRFFKENSELISGPALILSSSTGLNENDPQITEITIYSPVGNENRVLRGVYSSIYDLQQNPASQKELEKAKIEIKTREAIYNEKASNLAENLGNEYLIYGNLNHITNQNTIIDSITPKDVQEFAQKYMDLNKASIVVEHPSNPEISFGSSKATKKDSIEEYKLPNNLRVLVDHSLGITSTTAKLTLKSGKIPQAKPGVAYMLDVMLSDSIENSQNQDYITLNGLNITSKISKNTLSLNAKSLGEKTPQTIEGIEAILYHPDFDEKKFELLKKQVKDVFKENSKDPFTKSEEAIGDLWSGYSSKEILENIDNVTLEEVRNLHRKIITDSSGQVTIMLPDRTFQESKGQILHSLSQMPKMQKEIESKEMFIKPLDKSQIFIKVKNTDQTIIQQQFQTHQSGNIKDHAAIMLLDIILGGNINSKLTQDLREKQQIAYVAYCEHRNINDKNGVLALYTETKTSNQDEAENLGKVLAGFHNNVKDLIKNPVSEEELNRAKLSYKNTLLMGTESSEERNNMLQTIASSPYGNEHIEELFKAIDETTPQHIQRAAKLFLDKPSVISIETNQETLDKNIDFIKSFHKEKQINPHTKSFYEVLA